MTAIDFRAGLNRKGAALGIAFFLACGLAMAQTAPKFKVLGFSTTTSDVGHISYEREANRWLPTIAKQYGFSYDSTKVWSDCNLANLSKYQVVIFMDERPEDPAQREAFKKYMDNGGGWIGCHGSAFAMANSGQPMNWDWYHNTLIGAGEYKSNTWRPTSAFLKREDSTHAFMAGLPALFKSSPNEWYRWKVDLKTKPDIKILLSIDPTSFPLGTGPKDYEIWRSGYYPVVWTNRNYKMMYVNMGHNDIDYEGGTNKELSFQFNNEIQNKLILDGVLWMGGVQPVHAWKPARSPSRPGMDVRVGAGRFTVSRPGAGDFGISILDLQGNRIAEGGTATGVYSFDMGRFARGTYVVRTNSASGPLILALSLP